MNRVVVYAAPVLTDSLLRPFLPSADNFTQLVVERVWLLLKAQPNVLPHGEPAVTWRGLTGVIVTAFRDGKINVRSALRSDSAVAPRRPNGAALLSKAINTLRDEGEVVAWPEGVPVDSFSFSIDLISPVIDSSGKTSMPLVRIAVPLFSVAAPWEESVRVVRAGKPSYPNENQRDGASGYAVMQFVVDTTGRPDMSTVRDVWPPTKPRLTGSLRDYYVAFVNAARRGIEMTRFQPARIGGCAMRQLLQEPFSFDIRR
ncbi:MAG: energy transducer TonB [Gemmatimonadaceae bacterium]